MDLLLLLILPVSMLGGTAVIIPVSRPGEVAWTWWGEMKTIQCKLDLLNYGLDILAFATDELGRIE